MLYSCSLCEREYKSKDKYKKHLLRICSKRQEKNKSQKVSTDYYCENCKHNITAPSNAVLHYHSSHQCKQVDLKCSKCGRFETKDSNVFKVHVDVCKETEYKSPKKCPNCYFQFFDAKTLQDHDCSHVIQCQFCKNTGTVGEVQAHLIYQANLQPKHMQEDKTVKVFCYDVLKYLLSSITYHFLFSQGVNPNWLNDKYESF